jgi:hypothetical protein
MECIELAALGQAVARLSSDILPSSSTAGSTDRPVTATTDRRNAQGNRTLARQDSRRQGRERYLLRAGCLRVQNAPCS